MLKTYLTNFLLFQKIKKKYILAKVNIKNNILNNWIETEWNSQQMKIILKWI